MSSPKETEGGWMEYVRLWREKNPDGVVDYKALLQQYIKGIRHDVAKDAV